MQHINDMLDAYDAQFTLTHIMVAGIRTAVYSKQGTTAGKTLLFLHGIGGDYHGILPLAHQLNQAHSILMVDLPEHGQSERLPVNDSQHLLLWSKHLLQALQNEGHEVDVVIGHSYGCLPAANIACRQAVFLNPPTLATPAAQRYGVLLYRTRYIVAPVYNMSLFASWRGYKLLHDVSPDSVEYVKWVTKRTRSSTRLVVAQSSLVHNTRQILFDRGCQQQQMQVAGIYDKVIDVRPNHTYAVKTQLIPTGHMSFFDDCRMVATLVEAELSTVA